MTGQTTRLKEGVIPSVFSFPGRLCKVPRTARSSRTSQKAAAQRPDVHIQLSGDLKAPVSDHQYSLDPVKVKKKLTETQDKVEELQRDLRNAKDRERRHKKAVQSLLEDLKCKNMLTEDLQQKFDFDSDLTLNSLSSTIHSCSNRICLTSFAWT